MSCSFKVEAETTCLNRTLEARVPDICGPVEQTVYGRVGERSAVQTVQVECETCGVAAEEKGTSNQPPEIIGFTADPASPKNIGAAITWTASANDPDSDPIFYRFFQDNKPATNWTAEKGWTWMPSNLGSYRIEAQVRDGKHAGPGGMDDRKSERFETTAHVPYLKPQAPAKRGKRSSVVRIR